jgi:hypothetical protein
MSKSSRLARYGDMPDISVARNGMINPAHP